MNRDGDAHLSIRRPLNLIVGVVTALSVYGWLSYRDPASAPTSAPTPTLRSATVPFPSRADLAYVLEASDSTRAVVHPQGGGSASLNRIYEGVVELEVAPATGEWAVDRLETIVTRADGGRSIVQAPLNTIVSTADIPWSTRVTVPAGQSITVHMVVSTEHGPWAASLTLGDAPPSR